MGLQELQVYVGGDTHPCVYAFVVTLYASYSIDGFVPRSGCLLSRIEVMSRAGRIGPSLFGSCVHRGPGTG